MSQKRKPHLNTGASVGTPSKKRKEKGKTQTPPMQSVMVIGPTGKRRMEKRPW